MALINSNDNWDRCNQRDTHIPSIMTTYSADTDSRMVMVVSILVSKSAQKVAALSNKRIRIGKAYRT